MRHLTVDSSLNEFFDHLDYSAGAAEASDSDGDLAPPLDDEEKRLTKGSQAVTSAHKAVNRARAGRSMKFNEVGDAVTQLFSEQASYQATQEGKKYDGIFAEAPSTMARANDDNRPKLYGDLLEKASKASLPEKMKPGAKRFAKAWASYATFDERYKKALKAEADARAALAGEKKQAIVVLDTFEGTLITRHPGEREVVELYQLPTPPAPKKDAPKDGTKRGDQKKGAADQKSAPGAGNAGKDASAGEQKSAEGTAPAPASAPGNDEAA